VVQEKKITGLSVETNRSNHP